MQRRTLLKGTGAVLFSGLIAGCFSGNDDGNGGTTDQDTDSNGEAEGETVQSTQTKTKTKTTKSSGKASADVVTSELRTNQTSYDTEYIGFATVKNTGDMTLFQPRVTVKFIDSEGSLIESSEVSILHLKQGQEWDVYSTFLGTESTPESVNVELKPVERLGGKYTKDTDLKQSEIELQTGETTSVTGKVQNNTGSTASIMAYAQFITEDNTVLESTSDIINGVSNGETWSFNCESFQTNEDLLNRISDYELYVFAE